MEIIESSVTKDKKNKRTVYAFSVSGLSFEAHHYKMTKSRLEIFNNGTLLGTVDLKTPRAEYIVEAEPSPVKITAWIEVKAKGGAGIEVDGKPVQHTIADPDVHIKNGKIALYFLLAILAIKTFSSFGSGEPGGGILCFFMLLITVGAVILYKKLTKFAIITGLVLGGLEMIDFVTGIISIGGGGSKFVVIAWIFVRIAMLFNLINALSWKRKVEKAAKQRNVFDA